MTRAWSSGVATRPSGVRWISAACPSAVRRSQCGRMRSESVRLGRDRVDRDAVGAQLEGELAGERDDAALGGGVGARARPAEPAAGDRGQVDDLAAPLPLHHRDHRVGEEERPGQVEVDQLLPLLERELVQQGGGAAHDGAAAHPVDQDVDAPVGLDGLPDRALHRRRVEGVGAERERAAARGDDVGGQALEHGRLQVHAHHGAALARDDHRGRAADAGPRRRDQRHLALESRHGVVPPTGTIPRSRV